MGGERRESRGGGGGRGEGGRGQRDERGREEGKGGGRRNVLVWTNTGATYHCVIKSTKGAEKLCNGKVGGF